ncbi:MAG: NUMOD4 motif-containing HNH endonuclease, partial [Nitrospira sp.]|nr:NUMOD4 motif-containing HNH endonuclease [Nitrospira sp.]
FDLGVPTESENIVERLVVPTSNTETVQEINDLCTRVVEARPSVITTSPPFSQKPSNLSRFCAMMDIFRRGTSNRRSPQKIDFTRRPLNMKTKEEWRVIIDFPDYAVSSLGRVRRITDHHPNGPHKSGHILKPQKNKDGYYRVELAVPGRRKGKKVPIARIVATAFLPSPIGDRKFINHRNGVRTDNRPENLEWCTTRENHMHSIEVLGNQYGERHGSTKLSKNEVLKIHNLRMAGRGPTQLARWFNVSISSVKAILSRRLRRRELEDLPTDYPKLR